MGNPEKRDIGGLVEDREGSEIMLEYVNEKLNNIAEALDVNISEVGESEFKKHPELINLINERNELQAAIDKIKEEIEEISKGSQESESAKETPEQFLAGLTIEKIINLTFENIPESLRGGSKEVSIKEAVSVLKYAHEKKDVESPAQFIVDRAIGAFSREGGLRERVKIVVNEALSESAGSQESGVGGGKAQEERSKEEVKEEIKGKVEGAKDTEELFRVLEEGFGDGVIKTLADGSKVTVKSIKEAANALKGVVYGSRENLVATLKSPWGVTGDYGIRDKLASTMFEEISRGSQEKNKEEGSKEVSDKELKKMFREIVKVVHPDKVVGYDKAFADSAEGLFKRLGEINDLKNSEDPEKKISNEKCLNMFTEFKKEVLDFKATLFISKTLKEVANKIVENVGERELSENDKQNATTLESSSSSPEGVKSLIGVDEWKEFVKGFLEGESTEFDSACKNILMAA